MDIAYSDMDSSSSCDFSYGAHSDDENSRSPSSSSSCGGGKSSDCDVGVGGGLLHHHLHLGAEDQDGDQQQQKQKKRRRGRARGDGTVPVVRKNRRVKANDRERNRMHNLNDALDTLRAVLPAFPDETKLTKIETLRVAHNYIWALSETIRIADLQAAGGHGGKALPPPSLLNGDHMSLLMLPHLGRIADAPSPGSGDAAACSAWSSSAAASSPAASSSSPAAASSSSPASSSSASSSSSSPAYCTSNPSSPVGAQDYGFMQSDPIYGYHSHFVPGVY
ncbi:hypothetical protein NHX12_011013 [Muraenolepis orangiensis]|uniref:BHLH domain-containing protein n=1 Tax=Muraenolepis orangiensis TaxID=630683 RepID=A0A9Q0DGW4_9TELE|nr:hypothetical protein NHX12_011013 [Muraenolepis orangiensis]